MVYATEETDASFASNVASVTVSYPLFLSLSLMVYATEEADAHFASNVVAALGYPSLSFVLDSQ